MSRSSTKRILGGALQLFQTIERVKRGWKPAPGTINHTYTKVLRLQRENAKAARS